MGGKFKIGDAVVNKRPHGWREGVVVGIVPAGANVRRMAKRAGMGVRNFRADVPVRDHESYVVASGGTLYHPSVWRMEKKGGGE